MDIERLKRLALDNELGAIRELLTYCRRTKNYTFVPLELLWASIQKLYYQGMGEEKFLLRDLLLNRPEGHTLHFQVNYGTRKFDILGSGYPYNMKYVFEAFIGIEKIVNKSNISLYVYHPDHKKELINYPELRWNHETIGILSVNLSKTTLDWLQSREKLRVSPKKEILDEIYAYLSAMEILYAEKLRSTHTLRLFKDKLKASKFKNLTFVFEDEGKTITYNNAEFFINCFLEYPQKILYPKELIYGQLWELPNYTNFLIENLTTFFVDLLLGIIFPEKPVKSKVPTGYLDEQGVFRLRE